MAAQNVKQVLQAKLNSENYDKLMALANDKLHKFVADAIELAKPATVFVCTDKPEDIDYIRKLAVKNGEEKPLNIKGHTYHFDGYNDQGRDKEVTKYLLSPGQSLGKGINSMDKQEGTAEIYGLMDGIMAGREMFVCFFCLGPTNSEFSISCVQITDSLYVAHSETILYRHGYEQFKKLGNSGNFFRFLHGQGELENFVSKNFDKKRIYINLDDEIVYSVNTQYGGNTIGLKKLSLRLAIRRAAAEGWLAEHMFVVGVHGPRKRITYFTGAFPSACGKTSTSMLPGQTIIGDDIAYFRKKDGQMRTVNVEKGIFGIIQDVNAEDDPVIYKALTTPGEVIFSNVLIGDDNRPYWLGMKQPIPDTGTNHSGKWTKGKKDAKGAEITPSHKNARYTLAISSLENRDPMADAGEGVPVGGIIYGGRDSDTWVPVEQAFDWTEGIIAKGAALESETTAATIGAEGVRTFNPMSNLDFLSIPIGKYIQINLDFAKDAKKVPPIFSVNYFLKDEKGKYLNGMADKLVWVLWAELCAGGDVKKIETPTGYIPKYEDLKKLFKENLNKEYSQADYVKQFTIRVRQQLAKIDRLEKIYKEQVPDAPKVVFEVFGKQRDRLKKTQAKFGDNISPFDIESK
jgi:phosphoenolpyruvate carboxykinase (GTP)